MTCTNDTPVTDAELDAFYGRHVTEYERMYAIRRQSEAFDKDDLMDVLYEHGSMINGLLAANMPHEAGCILKQVRKETIARRASMELYGKPDVIKPSEVES